MKKIYSIALLMLAVVAFGGEAPLIPRPVSQKIEVGSFTLHKGDFAAVPMDAQLLYLAELSRGAGFKVALAPMDVSCAIQFLGVDSLPQALARPEGEGYVLRVLPKTVIIHAATPAGHFNGLQTLAQLMAGAETRDSESLTLPCQTICDAPRFVWRGFMLDVSRHFTDVAGIKRLLDAMAYYKLNRLHLHLTDSPAWRIEIKKYPLLAEVGGRGSETERSPDAPAQYFSQADIREIVVYARARNIKVIPEIDMPGHADAANRAYPENSGGGYTRSPGKWPNFTFNPARLQTLEFLDNVLREVAELFPDAKIIHLGGDEVHYGWKKWSSLPDVQALMKHEGFKNLREVETWFDRRMAATVNGLRFTTAGWDEFASRGLPQDKTLVFWWRHDKQGVLRKALDDGYSVVMCPRRPCYFDFVQHGSHRKGRRWGGFNSLDQVYRFPAGVKVLKQGDWQHIRGIQACLWTETTITQARRDFMAFPRLLALAEAAWTPANRKDYASFQNRLKPHIPELQARGLHPYDPFKNLPEIKR
jgi:hexosaminidase